jgi:hypothetical protein
MTFDWSQYLQLSRELAGLEPTPASQEAKFRSAISRAYYAAFNTAVDYIEAIEGVDYLPASTEKHFDVRRYFFAQKNKVSQQIADDLNYLRSQLNKADYENNARIDLYGVREAVRRSSGVLRQLSQLKP